MRTGMRTGIHRFAAGLALAAGLLGGIAARADTLHVRIGGEVDYNVIKGQLSGIPSGAPVSMDFDVDASDFRNSLRYPTRGYVVDIASFDLDIDGVHIPLDAPTRGDVYFVLRNNDPKVDGFFLSTGQVNADSPLTVHVPGLAPAHQLDFLRTFDTDTILSSLDIHDAIGHYGFEHMSSYLWTLGQGSPGAEFVVETIDITAVPEPASALLLGLGALVLLPAVRRRRRG